jgi:hypothetical protein
MSCGERKLAYSLACFNRFPFQLDLKFDLSLEAVDLHGDV